jgi:hypothetical protein
MNQRVRVGGRDCALSVGLVNAEDWSERDRLAIKALATQAFALSFTEGQRCAEDDWSEEDFAPQRNEDVEEAGLVTEAAPLDADPATERPVVCFLRGQPIYANNMERTPPRLTFKVNPSAADGALARLNQRLMSVRREARTVAPSGRGGVPRCRGSRPSRRSRRPLGRARAPDDPSRPSGAPQERHQSSDSGLNSALSGVESDVRCPLPPRAECR